MDGWSKLSASKKGYPGGYGIYADEWGFQEAAGSIHCGFPSFTLPGEQHPKNYRDYLFYSIIIACSLSVGGRFCRGKGSGPLSHAREVHMLRPGG